MWQTSPQSKQRESLLSYGGALLIVCAAVLIRKLFDPWVHGNMPLVTILWAVAIIVWVAGYRPAVLGMVFGYLACNYFFIEPRGVISIPDSAQFYRLLSFITTSAIIITLIQVLRTKIDKEKRAREEVRIMSEHLQLVTKIIEVPFIRCSRDLTFIWVSQSYARALGKKPEEIAGRPIIDIIGPEAFARQYPFFRRVLGREIVRQEERIQFPGMSPGWVRCVYTPTFDQTGTPDGWVAAFVDIDDRKRAEEALQAARQDKDSLMSVLADQLRSPLVAISSAVQLLQIRGAPNTEDQWARDRIDQQTRLLLSLVEDISDLSQISQGKLTLQHERLPVSAVVKRALEIAKPTIDECGPCLKLDVPEQAVFVQGDLTRLARVLSILLKNAARRTPRGAEVQIKVEHEDGNALLRVRDAGPGIDKEDMGRLFAGPLSGMGQPLGAVEKMDPSLILVRKVVELHAGTLAVSSEGLGKGTEFIMRLPATELRQNQGPHAEASVQELLPRPTHGQNDPYLASGNLQEFKVVVENNPGVSQ